MAKRKPQRESTATSDGAGMVYRADLVDLEGQGGRPGGLLVVPTMVDDAFEPDARALMEVGRALGFHGYTPHPDEPQGDFPDPFGRRESI